MTIYTEFVFEDKLISPINGKSYRRITKQNIKQFGFESIDHLYLMYPEFPLMCSQYQSAIGKDPSGLRKAGLNKRLLAVQKSKNDIELREKMKYAKNPKECKKCGKSIPFEKRNGSHCSMSCSNGRPKDNKTRKKISEWARNNPSGFRLLIPIKKMKNCIVCGTDVYRRKTCSLACYKQHRKNIRIPRDEYMTYRNNCAFKFNVFDYPDELNLSLIETYGWYKAKNRGDNPDGISRDHLVSVKYGFNNNISPFIISHPANCQLISQRKNSSKHIKCEITLEELVNRIIIWNEKYGGP